MVTTSPALPEMVALMLACEELPKPVSMLVAPKPMNVPPLMVPLVSKSSIELSPVAAPEVVTVPPSICIVPFESSESP